MTAAFLEYIEKKKKASRNTLAAYRQDLNGFGHYLEEKGMTLEKATNTQVVAYIMLLKKEGKSRATVNRKLASLRAFYRYLIGQGLIQEDPTCCATTKPTCHSY